LQSGCCLPLIYREFDIAKRGHWCDRGAMWDFLLPAVNRPGFSRVFVVDYTEKGARFNILDLFHEPERTEFKVWTREYKGILLKDDHEELLANAGFSSTEFYGSYSFEPYDKASSDLLVCLGIK